MNSKKHIQWLSLLIVFLVFFGFGQSAWAQETTTGPGDWSNNATWTDGSAPAPGAVVQILHAVTLDVDANPTSVEITAAGGSIDLSGNTLTVDNDFTNTSGTGTVIVGTAANSELIVGGDFISNAAGTFDFSGNGILDITGALTLTSGILNISGSTVTVGGAITGAGTFTTDDATDLTLDGTANVTLPAGFDELLNLTIAKGASNVVTLAGPLTIGDASAGVLTLTTGKLDLDGNNITLLASASISEANTYQIINTGNSSATEGYITTPTILGSAANATGIGVTSITPAASNYVIRRYVIPTASPISVSGVGSAIDRVYRISTTLPTAITLKFDNTEVNSLITDLSLYTSTALAITSPVTQNNAGKTNRTIGLAAGQSTVAYSSFNGAVALDNYYTLASENLPANTKVFTGLNDEDWNDAGNWNPAEVPLATDNVLIPSGKAVEVDANAVCNNITITDATATVATGITLDINGNLALNGTSALTAATATAEVEFSGTAVQTITVAEDSYCEFGILTIDNASNGVTTASNITIKNYVITGNSSAFTATAGTQTFNPSTAAATVLWNAASGDITLNDVIINLADLTGDAGVDANPGTSITINGDLTRIGAGTLTATAGTITFTNTNLAGKTIQVAGGVTTLFNLNVSAGSKIATASSFSLAGTGGTDALNIGSNAEFIAEAGTITFTGAAADIGNSGTLEFNDFVVAATALATTTTADFTIKGNMTVTALGAFTASSPSTITFDNDSPKDLVCGGTTTFANLLIAANSTLETTTSHDFVITGTGSIELESGATFTQAAAGTVSFAAAGNKNIIVADNASLTFGIVSIADAAGNNVLTSDNFTVSGNSFGLAALTGPPTFVASSPSVITFSGATFSIQGSTAAAGVVFHDIVINGGVGTLADGEFMEITGDITLNGAASSLVVADEDSKITFNGSAQQLIGYGATASTVDPAINLGIVVVNKSGSGTDGELLLNADVDIALDGAGALTLTNGVLNLGSSTLTLDATVVNRTNGLINGGTGTLRFATVQPDLNTHMKDATFTINGTPTLYNLQIDIASTSTAALDGTLTVNGTLYLNDDLTITGQNLIIKGSIDQDAVGDEIVYTAATAATSKVTFDGTGTVNNLSNTLFIDEAPAALAPSLEFKRGETLTGNLTLGNTSILTINTSTQYLDLNGFDLDLNGAATIVLNRLSGGIDASATGSGVLLGTHASQTTIPANLFKNNEVYDLTLENTAYTLGGDLTVLNALAQLTAVHNLYTKNNTLTIGPNFSAVPAWVAATHVVGNLQRTVTNSATVFPVGNGTATTGFSPLSLQFQTAGSSQVVKVSSQKVNPTFGRGGDPTRAINALWTITPSGTAPSDNIAIDFGWDDDYMNGLAVGATTTFPAKWNGTSWTDYRTAYATASSTNFVATNEISPSSAFPINANSLSGEWTSFVAASASETDKNLAISVSRNKLAIKNITPSIVEAGVPFTATVEYQDQYGNGQIAETAITLTFTNVLGSLSGIPNAVIAAGTSSVVVTGFAYATATAGNQFKVTGTGDVQAGISPVINVIGSLPSNQVNTIALTASTTSTTLGFALAGSEYGIIIAKAGSAITSDDFPVDGTTYFASNNFGEGSKIGGAVVVYKGQAPGSAVTISGLAPNTTYYFRGFSYGTATTAGTEKYLTFAAANNPKSVTTSGSANNDDDIDFGSNNTMETAKPIGANSPIKGTIKTAEDVDWFSFTITNSAPNLRARLTLSAALGNYNVELYNVDGRRLRRGTRLSNNIENQVINELTPGTYLVKISGVNGAFDADNNYTLQLTTDGNEIYSVTE